MIEPVTCFQNDAQCASHKQYAQRNPICPPLTLKPLLFHVLETSHAYHAYEKYADMCSNTLIGSDVGNQRGLGATQNGWRVVQTIVKHSWLEQLYLCFTLT